MKKLSIADLYAAIQYAHYQKKEWEEISECEKNDVNATDADKVATMDLIGKWTNIIERLNEELYERTINL